MTNARPSGAHARELGHVLLGCVEVLDDVRRAHPVDGAVAHAELAAVHRREDQAVGAERGRRVDRGLGAVVDADHGPARSREVGGLGADPAPDVEHDAGPEAQPHLPVARGMEREQRVGSGALHRTLAGEAGHAPAA